MTAEQPEQSEVEEKEEKRKIKVVEQIDNRLAVQGQAYIKGQLKEALTLAYEIIELAKPEGLKSFIKEQEDFIARIKRAQKEKEEREKERIRVEQEKIRLGKIKKIKIELNQLEANFNEALKIEDFQQTQEIFDNAKGLLTRLDDEKINLKWKEYENTVIKAKVKKELTEKAELLIEESIELKENYQFDELKDRLADLLEQLKENEIDNYYTEIKAVQSDVLNSEKLYLKTLDKIEELVNKISRFQENEKFKEAISNCEELIQNAKSIKKNNLVNIYSKLLLTLKEDLRFKELRELIHKLNEEGLDFLKNGKIVNSLKTFKLIQTNLREYESLTLKS